MGIIARKPAANEQVTLAPAPASEATQQPVPRAADAPPSVIFDRATKRFGKEEVLHGLSFSVQPGTILGVIGPSGSGKSTTVKLMLGMFKPTSGTVRCLGRNPWKLRRGDKERIGYMPQDFVLYPTLTAEETLRFVAAVYGIPFWEARERSKRLLDFVDLGAAHNRRADDLSGGMKRRLSLAATLMHNPDFLVLDEPTAGIDPILRVTIWDELRHARESGKTLVITTQYVTEAEYCDQVLLIYEGDIIAAGTPDELRKQASGGDMLDIRFDEPRPDTAVRLETLPYVQSVEPGEHPNQLRVTVDNLQEDLPQIQEYCDLKEGGCTSIEPHVPTFEDVFVRLVTQAKEKGEARGDGHDIRPAA